MKTNLNQKQIIIDHMRLMYLTALQPADCIYIWFTSLIHKLAAQSEHGCRLSVCSVLYGDAGWDGPASSTDTDTDTTSLSVLMRLGLFRVTVAGTGVQFLTTQELRDRARRCRFLWKVITLCGGDMDRQIEQPAVSSEFLLSCPARCWKQHAKLCFLEFD